MNGIPQLAGLALGLVLALPATAGAKPPAKVSACGGATWAMNRPPSCVPGEKWVAYSPPPGTPGNDVFKVWYPAGDQTAQSSAKKVLNLLHNRYQPLVKLFGRKPISDAGCQCDGGDGRIDVYLTPRPSDPLDIGRGTQTPSFPVAKLCASPVYINLNRGDYLCSDGILEPILAHELTHAFQQSYAYAPPCAMGDREPLFAWLAESTAVWSEWVFFGGNVRDRTFKDGVCIPEDRTWAEKYLLDKIREPLPANPYEGWMFPLYLSLHHGEEIVPRIWKRLETQRDVAGAVEWVVENTAGAAEWQAMWPKFSVANFNLPPADDYSHEGIRAEGLRDTVQVPGGGLAQVPFAASVPPLAAHHFEVQVGAGVHMLAFETGLGDSVPAAFRVQALPQAAGRSRGLAEDWTQRRAVTYCRDQPDQNVADILLVVSNGDWSPKAPPFNLSAARWLASDVHCGPWTGHFSFTSDAGNQAGPLSSSEHQEIVVDAELDPTGVEPTEEGLQVLLAGHGTLTYRWSGKAANGSRSTTCGGEKTVAFGAGTSMLQLRHTLDGKRQFQLAGATAINGSVGVGCDGQPVNVDTVVWPFTQGWLPLDSPAAANGTVNESDETTRIVRSWTLTAKQ